MKNVSFRFSPKSQSLFFLTPKTAEAMRKGTVVRIAGGWVRDKVATLFCILMQQLLGNECCDIDVALDNMMGVQFVDGLLSVLQSDGLRDEVHGVGVVRANPEQSKHLETATLTLFGFAIDFVNLRTETYADSRIPDIRVGTPEEDAYRRDLTINAMFYNVTQGAVEDFTNKVLFNSLSTAAHATGP
jgi:tRNA nucleotidyltransferase/poly(A) polymerase